MNASGRIFTVLAAMIALPQMVCAQPKSVGLRVGHSGFGAEYEHRVAGNADNFHSIGAEIDLTGRYRDQAGIPGQVLDYCYNFAFGRVLGDGGLLQMYVGAGAAAGFVRDDGFFRLRGTDGEYIAMTGTREGTAVRMRQLYGVAAGMKIRLGIEYSSPAIPVTASAALAPIIGFHGKLRDEGGVVAGIYKNGLMRGLMPEFTIKYDFGRVVAGCREPDAFRRLTVGIESDYSPVVYRIRHANFFDEDNQRHFIMKSGIGYNPGGSVLAQVGVNADRRINVSLLTGCRTIASGAKVLPVLLRASIFPVNGANESRPFVFIDGGPGFCFRNELMKPAMMFSTGGGYVMSLGRFLKVGFIFGLNYGHYCPTIPDSTLTTRSTEDAIGLKIGTNFSF